MQPRGRRTRGHGRWIAGQAPGAEQLVSESEFQQTVIELARLTGWIVGFTANSRRSEPGEPDLRMVHPEQCRVIFAELKVGNKTLTKGQWNKRRWLPGQDDWAAALQQCPGVEYYLWGPADWANIEKLLTGSKRQFSTGSTSDGCLLP